MSNTCLQHVGIRSPMGSWKDYENDYEVGFVISHADEMEEIGWRGVVKKIRETVGDNPVYSAPNDLRIKLVAVIDGFVVVTFDIDAVDPGSAPAYVLCSSMTTHLTICS